MFYWFRNIIFFCVSWVFLSACYAGDCDNLNPKTCSVLKDFVVADSNREIGFKHLCSTLDKNDGFSRSAYAFFEKQDKHKKYKALVLGEVEAGWVSSPDPQTDIIGFSLTLEKMQVEQLTEWAGQLFSIALEVKNKNTKQVVTGAPSSTYFYSHQGIEPVDKQYTISDKGHLNWEKLIEPEEEEQKNKQTEAGTCVACEKEPIEAPKRNEYKGSHFIQVDKNHIKNPENPHTLYLVLKNKNTGETIKLRGPDISNLAELFKSKFSRPRVLTWEVLNPLQEGGLWDVISDAFKYGDCIYLRKKAKKDFDKRFAS